ncbi:MAG: Maf family protein [Ruminococcus sp.]|nr:Maf family protein [Ruminococcus sp.]
MKNVILASASPRRQELLKYIFDEFDIIPADVDESISEDIAVDIRPEKIAERKALHIAEKHPESMVIGCDTAVIVDDIMLGKPKDEHDARKMLRMLSGRTHKVITGNSIVCDNRIKSFSVTTEVEFYLLTEDEINDYISTDDWRDKAGAYGIQGKAGLFVKQIKGDYNNVVGLPCAELNRQLKQI